MNPAKMKAIPLKLGFMGVTCLFYMISAVVLLSAYFATEKLTNTALFMTNEARLFVIICSGIHFALAAISFFTTCSVARLQTEYVYADDKWVRLSNFSMKIHVKLCLLFKQFNELWLMLDMDHDKRYLTKRLEEAESGDHDDDDADDEDEDEYLEPNAGIGVSLSDISSLDSVGPGEKFYPLKMVETEEIVVEVPDTTLIELVNHLEKDELQKAEDGKENIFTLTNVLMTLQSSSLGKLSFPTDTKLRRTSEDPKVQNMKLTMERSATELVEGIHVKTVPVHIPQSMTGHEQSPTDETKPDRNEGQPMVAKVEVHQPDTQPDNNGQERVTMVFTIEKALSDDLDIETLGKSGLEQISEMLDVGRMY